MQQIGGEKLYKKPIFWIICLAVLGCIVTGICLLLNAGDKNTEESQVVSESNVPETQTASEPEESREEPEYRSEWERIWYETRDYPLRYEDVARVEMDWGEQIQVLNPPMELIADMTTEELADLALRYPLFSQMPWYVDEQKDIWCSIYADYSNIFAELLQRENHVSAILNAFRDMELDIEAFESLGYYNGVVSVQAECFVEDFVLAYGKTFTKEEQELYRNIMKERSEKYYSRISYAENTAQFGMVYLDPDGNPIRARDLEEMGPYFFQILPDDDKATVKAALKYVDEENNLVWEYQTEEIGITELDVVQRIGFLHEGYCFIAGGKLYCIAIKGEEAGTPLWINEEFGGASASVAVEDKYGLYDMLYVTGFYGPDLMVVNGKTGETLYRYEHFDWGNLEGEEFYWPMFLELEDGKIRIGYASNDAEILVNPENGRVLEVRNE